MYKAADVCCALVDLGLGGGEEMHLTHIIPDGKAQIVAGSFFGGVFGSCAPALTSALLNISVCLLGH